MQLRGAPPRWTPYDWSSSCPWIPWAAANSCPAGRRCSAQADLPQPCGLAASSQQGHCASITSQGKIMRLKQRPLMGHTGSSELRSSRRSVQASPQTCAAPQRSQTKMLLLSCLHGSPRRMIASPIAGDVQGELAEPSEQAIFTMSSSRVACGAGSSQVAAARSADVRGGRPKHGQAPGLAPCCHLAC